MADEIFCSYIPHILIYINKKIAYSTQGIDIEIPNGSRDYVIIPDTVKITFNIDKSMQYR